MNADKSYTHVAEIDSRDVDAKSRCRPSALLGHLQEAATLASEDAGSGRGVLLERYGGVWMLARMRFELTRPLRWEERLAVTTWHRRPRAGSLYRDFDLACGGQRVGTATSLWALVDVETRKILNLARIPELAASTAERPDRTEQLSHLRLPLPLEETERRPMRYSDTDINGHVNNTRYADFACDAIRADLLPPEQYVRAMQIGYTAECRAGEVLTISVGGAGEERFVRGADPEGAERFCARLALGRSPE